MAVTFTLKRREDKFDLKLGLFGYGHNSTHLMATVGPSHRSRVSMSLQGGAVAQSASGTVLGECVT